MFTLAMSSIPTAGIGCFSHTDVRLGDRISHPRPGIFRRLPGAKIPPQGLKYCILLQDDLFLAPADFHHMGVFWYVNHSVDPNCSFDGLGLFARKPIAPGDELTLYYSDIETHPLNRIWAKPSDIIEKAA